MNYIKTNGPSKTSDLIDKLFADSGQKDKRKFSQGIFTALTRMYVTKKLVHNNGVVTIA